MPFNYMTWIIEERAGVWQYVNVPFNNKAELHYASVQMLNMSRLNQKSPQHISNTSQTVCVDKDTNAFQNPAQDTNEGAKRR